jgi:DNA-binding MarR family transcriptional regulator
MLDAEQSAHMTGPPDEVAETPPGRLPVLGWLRLARIYQRIDHATADLMRRWDLSVAQFDVLNMLGLHEGITQQELADRLLVTKGNISQLIARMERRGLIRRCQEGRAMRLHLTEAGRHLRATVLPAQEALVARHFAHLTQDEAHTLHTLLRRVDRGG